MVKHNNQKTRQDSRKQNMSKGLYSSDNFICIPTERANYYFSKFYLFGHVMSIPLLHPWSGFRIFCGVKFRKGGRGALMDAGVSNKQLFMSRFVRWLIHKIVSGYKIICVKKDGWAQHRLRNLKWIFCYGKLEVMIMKSYKLFYSKNKNK